MQSVMQSVVDFVIQLSSVVTGCMFLVLFPFCMMKSYSSIDNLLTRMSLFWNSFANSLQSSLSPSPEQRVRVECCACVGLSHVVSMFVGACAAQYNSTISPIESWTLVSLVTLGSLCLFLCTGTGKECDLSPYLMFALVWLKSSPPFGSDRYFFESPSVYTYESPRIPRIPTFLAVFLWELRRGFPFPSLSWRFFTVFLLWLAPML